MGVILGMLFHGIKSVLPPNSVVFAKYFDLYDYENPVQDEIIALICDVSPLGVFLECCPLEECTV